MDEAHHFLLAKDSSSFLELYKNATYEGHPLLWNGLLFLITRFSSEVFYMQLLNISIMAICVYLFVTHAPFKKLFSILIVFGYFFIYEYNIISRNYAISLLCLTLVFIQLNKPSKKHYLLAACLILLSLTHIYSTIIAIALCCILIFQNKNSNVKYIYLGIIAFTVLLLYSLQVPADHALFKFDNTPYFSYSRIGKGFSIYLKGILPIPDPFSFKVWNSNMIVGFSKAFGAIISVIIALVPFFIFRKNKVTLFFFYFSTLGICSFIYLSPIIVAMRYCGFFFVVLVFAFWLKKVFYPNDQEYPATYKKISIIVLSLHILSGIYLFVTDLQRPFSAAKDLANFILEKKLETKTIYLSNLCTGPPVSVYLNKKIICLETGEKNSFCKWNTWPFILTVDQISEKLKGLTLGDTSLFILSSNYEQGDFKEIDKKIAPALQIQQIRSFSQAMVTSENYTLYYLIKK